MRQKSIGMDEVCLAECNYSKETNITHNIKRSLYLRTNYWTWWNTYKRRGESLEQQNINPIVCAREVNRPRQYITLSQNAIAAPSGPHVSGIVMQATDRLPRFTHCLSVWFTLSPVLIWKYELKGTFCSYIMDSDNNFLKSIGDMLLKMQGMNNFTLLTCWKDTSGCMVHYLDNCLENSLSKRSCYWVASQRSDHIVGFNQKSDNLVA